MNRILGKLFGGHSKQPEPDAQHKEIIDSLASKGLGQIAPDVLRLARQSIRIDDKDNPAGPLAVGTSRLGGQPDLPPGSAWPACKGLPMSFVGQLRLEEVAPYDSEHLLPASGLLSFFYDAKQETYGADPDDLGGWQVQYHAGDLSTWQPQPFPADLPEGSRFKPVGVTFHNELTFPTSPCDADPSLRWSDDEVQRYENWLVDRFSPAERAQPHHRMFGYPDQIQDDMQLESALASHGFHSQDDPGAQAAISAKADWLLLLQVDSDDRAGMRWGSAGRIFYWIESTALHTARFDQAWLVMQSD